MVVRGHRVHDGLGHAVLGAEIPADDGVRALHFVADGLAGEGPVVAGLGQRPGASQHRALTAHGLEAATAAAATGWAIIGDARVADLSGPRFVAGIEAAAEHDTGADALTELPRVIAAVRDAVAGFAVRYPRSRVLVTCRTLSYQDPAWRLEEFPEHELAPFDGEQIDQFIGTTLGAEAQALGAQAQAAGAAGDLAAAQDWASNDPYAKAGLFSDVTLRAWKKVIG